MMEQTKETLYKLCDDLNEITKKQGVELRPVEIKGTVYFFPLLPESESESESERIDEKEPNFRPYDGFDDDDFD